MKQVVGYIHNDGQSGGQTYNNYDDVGYFEVEKTEDGTYKITFQRPFSSYPIVSLTPVNANTNANVVLYSAYGDYIEVKAGYTDKPDADYTEGGFFFIAMGPE